MLQEVLGYSQNPWNNLRNHSNSYEFIINHSNSKEVLGSPRRSQEVLGGPRKSQFPSKIIGIPSIILVYKASQQALVGASRRQQALGGQAWPPGSAATLPPLQGLGGGGGLQAGDLAPGRSGAERIEARGALGTKEVLGFLQDSMISLGFLQDFLIIFLWISKDCILIFLRISWDLISMLILL